MKVNNFIEIIKNYSDYEIVSDSGWECGETDIDGAIISHELKKIILVPTTYIIEDGYYEKNDLKSYNKNYKTTFEILY